MDLLIKNGKLVTHQKSFVADIAVENGRAYIASASSGLEVIDVTDLTHPRKCGGYEVGKGATSVFVRDRQVYLSAQNGIWILEYVPGEYKTRVRKWIEYK